MFPREYTGFFAENDVFIDCYKDCKIFHYGNRILEYYCPSLGRGHNIIKAIKSQFQGEENIIHNIVETDEEILFRFNAKDMERLEPFLKPKTSGASISPFSSRNLPKNKDYKIPDEESLQYKNIIEKIGKKHIIELTHMTNNFIKNLARTDSEMENIKLDMAQRGLSGKNYIHSIGMWNEYINYIRKELKL